MNQIYLTIILTASAGAVGFLIRMFIDNINDILKNKKLDKLKHNEFLLSEFYMPIYILLHRENAIWENLIRSDCIIKKQEFITELDTEILNNHLEIQKIIINNMAKASPREDIACQLLLYDNHVTIFKTLRKIGSKDFPLKYHCEYPKNLYNLIETRIYELKEDKKILIGLCGSIPECYEIHKKIYNIICCCFYKTKFTSELYDSNIKLENKNSKSITDIEAI
tara:strand:- start:3708 stop:4376 length:669 start_codon:yes stop_codon:yes gene_type:complete